jgi:hypothetical protein
MVDGTAPKHDSAPVTLGLWQSGNANRKIAQAGAPNASVQPHRMVRLANPSPRLIVEADR